MLSRMENNLKSLKLLCERHEFINKQINFDFSDAQLILELSFADKFLIYHSSKSESFLLFNFASIYTQNTSYTDSDSFQYFMSALTLNEILEEINRILTLDHKEEFNVRTHKWYSAIPPWLNLTLSFVNVDFAQIYLNSIQTVINTSSDLSKDEAVHVQEVISKLKAKLNTL